MELNFSSFFTAAILCPVLTAPINGDVDVPSREVDSTATYSCDDGFSLSGLETRACLSNGRWFGIPPICTPGKKIILLCFITYNGAIRVNFVVELSFIQSCILNSLDIIDCGELDDPANGMVMTMGTTEGSMAVYTCETGFFLEGGMSRRCQANGAWSGNEPICSRKLKCLYPLILYCFVEIVNHNQC